MLKILLLCGGKGNERNISINSVRSVYDHVKGLKAILPIVVFFDTDDSKYLIDEEYLYSNTSDDFRFLLHSVSPLSDASFFEFLKDCDFVFPVIHGVGGEDGTIQKTLEENDIKFIGSPSIACKNMYNKHIANDQIISARKMPNIPKIFIDSMTNETKETVSAFISNHGKVCIKPVEGGSSYGVHFAETTETAVETIDGLLKEYHEIVVEKVCSGKEFTIIVLENRGLPVALIPTEIDIQDGGTFDRRRKYMPTTEVHYYCPARFDIEIIDAIRSEAEKLFAFAGARDFLRIDGWLLDDGRIYFSDFNPISGMEQNSFIFQQAAKIGLTHGTLLEYIIRNACNRYNVLYPEATSTNENKRRVNVLLGGNTSERQVSLLSGTNVWMKLLHSAKYSPIPYILTTDSDNRWIVCEIPYAIALLHTTEEIIDQIDNGIIDTHLINQVQRGLGLKDHIHETKPEWITLDAFVAESKQQNAYVFLGLHGGFGENGGIQSILAKHSVDFNGSDSRASELCMDKYLTGTVVTSLGISKLRTCKKVFGDFTANWHKLEEQLGSPFIAKPNRDGCSTGVVKIRNKQELEKYIDYFQEGVTIPPNTFSNQSDPISMSKGEEKVLFEEYIQTDSISINNGNLEYEFNTGWIELTIGVIETTRIYHAFNPSVTVAENAILSVEEKFQGGVGINLTPPPENILNHALSCQIKSFAEQVAEKCGIKGYCRIDLFANNKTGEIIIIEINTLPGLSPSTVLFQQAAKEQPPLSPLALLERIIESREALN